MHSILTALVFGVALWLTDANLSRTVMYLTKDNPDRMAGFHNTPTGFES